MPPTNFQPLPKQEQSLDLKGGLRIQAFRRDPSKFFEDIPKWAESLNLGKIEHMAVSEGPSGHINLVIAYRPYQSAVDLKQAELQHDTLALVCDLADAVRYLQERMGFVDAKPQREALDAPAPEVPAPPVSSSSVGQESAGAIPK